MGSTLSDVVKRLGADKDYKARFEAAFAKATVPTVVADDVTFFERWGTPEQTETVPEK